MPSCFQLTRNGDSQPSVLQYIDRCICQNCDIPFSEERWAHNWYNFLGLGIAIGNDLDRLIDIAKDHDDWTSVRIAAYLKDNYTSDAWHEAK